MRISDLTLSASLGGELQADQQALAALDGEISSGLAIQQPSDDPVGAVQVLADRRQIAQLAAYQSTAQAASSWLGLAGQTVTAVLDSLQTARTVVLQALSSGSQTTQSYQAYAEQLSGTLQTLVGLANTTYGETPIFAGTAGVAAAYSPTGAYNGNSTPFTMQVGPGTTVAVSVPGTSLFGGGPTGVQDLFTTLGNLVADLSKGPGPAAEAGLTNDLAALDANISLAEQASTTIGESSRMVSSAESANTAASTQLQGALGTLEDANLGVLGPQFQADLTAYQAALAAASQTLPETLAAFLK
ncbi:MAG TPA: hypothetical protein VKV23_08165 [Acidimicrobiales bacterium]|jgi:flagellar hook-associated protein 3 FlgL|nr:hypothetical protein [Acidimicrobiales bacterium]